MHTAQRQGLFYGWIIVAAALAIIALGMGLMFSLGVFMEPLENALGWSRGQISQANLYGWVAFGFSAFGFGLLSDRVGTRVVVRIGGGMLGLGLLGLSQMQHLWHFYLLYGLLIGGAVGAFNVPLTALVTRWFVKHRGLAVALSNCGIGVGGFLFAPMSRSLIMSFDWRTTFFFYGLLTWIVVIPLTLLLRERPQDMGLQPLIAFGSASAEGKSEEEAVSGLSTRRPGAGTMMSSEGDGAPSSTPGGRPRREES